MRYLILFITIILAASCGKRESILTVSAAADLTDAFTEIGREFTARTGAQVRFNFGSTGQLAQQIEQGAPVDLFAAASISHIDELERKGRLIQGSRRIYGQGRLVIWTRADAPFQIERIEDLRRKEIRRIAIANPQHAPYGIAAREALQATGLWEEISPRLVLGENVRQTMRYAETGDVDAAIVALSLCRNAGSDPKAGPTGRWIILPQELYRPLDQAAAVVSGSRHLAEANGFIEYVTNGEGRAVLERYGFAIPAIVTGSRPGGTSGGSGR